ncbi:MAG TPA: flavodoxin domain-containing protein [Nocardioidaceae bacterium]|nr:flavodoxin domain-containing protein [Nocardioidaceae bacterium]
MTVFVTYASKHGATRGIAERIAHDLNQAGVPTDIQHVTTTGDIAGYDAFVIGSATYAFHWMKEAQKFVRDHQKVLAERPVWLFSSGPLGEEKTDAEGNDVRESSRPREIAELTESIHPRGDHVFFGALDPEKLSFGERAIRRMPAARKLMPEGDYRDWDDVDEWAGSIAEEIRAGSKPERHDG